MNLLQRLLSWLRRGDYYKCFCKDYYVCPWCGYVFPKKGANIAGWETHAYGYHVHCPECGKLVDTFLKIKLGVPQNP